MKKSLAVKLEKIFKKGMKYNMIDRFFYFLKEEKKLKKIINSTPEFGYWEEPFKHEFLRELKFKIETLKEDIKKSFGISHYTAYVNSEKTMIIDNPYLLGISPLLFEHNEWKNIIINDVSKRNFNSIYDIETILMASLREALYRLEINEFLVNEENKNTTNYSTNALFSLIADDIFEIIEDSKNIQNIENESGQKKETKQDTRISLKGYMNTGKLITKITEGFGKKGINLSEDERTNIQRFVSQNFKNSAGKQHIKMEISNRNFLITNIKLIKSVLLANKEQINCNNLEISRLIKNTFPEYLGLKTIENY